MGAEATGGVGAKAKVGTANGAIVANVGIVGTVGIPGTGIKAAGITVGNARGDLRVLAVGKWMTITSVTVERVGLSDLVPPLNKSA